MPDSDDAPRVRTERDGHLALLALSRPAKRNAADLAMLVQLAAAFGEADRDPEVRCVVVHADGEHFTAGLDLADIAPRVTGGRLDRVPDGGVDPWGVAGPRMTTPVVVAVRGVCFTLGIELILAADVAVAATSARFAQLEVLRGILPFGGATLRLPARVGWGDAMRWLLTGDELDAAEALRIGLVQEVVDGDPLPAALAIARRIADAAPLAVSATLRAARAALALGPDAAASVLPGELDALLATDDAAEGARALAERRPARFAGR